jgi:hypothetical protein
MSNKPNWQSRTFQDQLPTDEETILVQQQTQRLQHRLEEAKSAEAEAHRAYSSAYLRWKTTQAERSRIERQLAEMYKHQLQPTRGPRGSSTQAETVSKKKEKSAVKSAARALKGLSKEQLQALMAMIEER